MFGHRGFSPTGASEAHPSSVRDATLEARFQPVNASPWSDMGVITIPSETPERACPFSFIFNVTVSPALTVPSVILGTLHAVPTFVVHLINLCLISF